MDCPRGHGFVLCFRGKLLGLPVVVGGLGPRSVVASASYESRKFGVRSAMPMGEARRLCKELVVVPPHFDKYFEISTKVFEELKKLAPVIEQVSVDEAYLDFTGCERLYKSREASAQAVKKAVAEVSGLKCTVAISTNKLISKIASDFAKPDGLLVVPAGDEEAFMRPLSIRKIPGVGPKTALILERFGIQTCDQLAQRDPKSLKGMLGNEVEDLQGAAKGLSFSVVDPGGERKSLSAEETFDRDQGDMLLLNETLGRMAEDISTDLRSESLRARTVQIKLRYADFTTLTRARTLEVPTHIAREIAEVGRELLKEHKDPRLKLRLLGIGVRNFVPLSESRGQMNFFEDPIRKEKEEKLEFAKDQLKKKFGKKILGVF